MKNKKLIVTALFAAVLLSAAFLSLAAADDETPLIAPLPDPTTMVDHSTSAIDGNSTQTPDNTLYTIQENSTDPAGNGTEIEQPTLITASDDASGSVLPLVAAVLVVAFVAAALGVGVVFYRKSQQTQSR